LWERTTATVVFVTHSVEEALFMADRVYVLSGRPARVREVLEVDLPRPRSLEAMLGTPEYAALHRRVAALLL
jgi:NitT/TauT family transport system ATP-binding protein